MSRIVKRITFCGQPALFACDGNCRKAWGINSRPRIELSANPDDYALLSDSELGDAPVDPGSDEGGHAKPLVVRGPEDVNKWCVRECERGYLSAPGEYDRLPVLPDYSKRRANIRGHVVED